MMRGRYMLLYMVNDEAQYPTIRDNTKGIFQTELPFHV